MKVATRSDAIRLIVAVSVLAGLVVAICLLWYSSHLSTFVREVTTIFKGKDELRVYVESWGPWAPGAFVGIQALQVVFAPIPGELTGAVGGFIFGALPNILYSTIGLTVGSICAFCGGRVIGMPLVKLMVSEKTWERFSFLTERRGTLLSLALFVIPGFPKDILSYILGLSPMGFIPFVTVCTIGRLPGTVLLSYSGSAVYNEDWALLILLSVVCAAILAIAFFYREKLDLWLRKHGSEPAVGDGPSSPAGSQED